MGEIHQDLAGSVFSPIAGFRGSREEFAGTSDDRGLYMGGFPVCGIEASSFLSSQLRG